MLSFSYSYDCERYSQQPKDRDSTTTEGKKRAPSASTFLNFCITSWFWMCVACLSRMRCLGGGARRVGGKKCLKLAAGPRVKRRRVGASTLHQQHHHPPRFQRKPFHFCGNCTIFLKSWLLAHVVDWISRQVAPCLVWSPTKPALPSTLPLLLEMRSSWQSSKHCCVMGLNDWCGKSGGGFALRRCFCKGFCFPRWHDW